MSWVQTRSAVNHPQGIGRPLTLSDDHDAIYIITFLLEHRYRRRMMCCSLGEPVSSTPYVVCRTASSTTDGVKLIGDPQ